MTDTTEVKAKDVVSVVIDGAPFDAHPGELLIAAAERAGVFIPRFCYHPGMDPVGMCRMCLVEVSGPRGFSLQPACFIHVSEGQEVLTSSPKARKAQEGVLEFLLINHPLDCPVCDKGGECPLQDQALSHGPGESRFIEEKRHWAKPIEIGPLVALDRERCIQCARCTRFADEVAGEALIDFAFRGDAIEVAPFPSEPFSSYFSGNTVQICPVGALTAVPYRFKSRPWDLEQVETTCTTCAVGCRVVAQSSAGSLVRYLGVDSEPVNQSWLCDKGRFSFESILSPNRISAPLVLDGGEQRETTWTKALAVVGDRLGPVRNSDSSRIGVIGGSRLTNEDAYAWAKLAKSVLGTDSVDAQLGDGLSADAILGLPRATIDETTNARLIVLMAPDLREELPVLFLRIREAVTKAGRTLLEIGTAPSSLSSLASSLRVHPGEIDRAISLLVGSDGSPNSTELDETELESARALLRPSSNDVTVAGDGVVVVFGRQSVSEDGAATARAVALLHEALPGARFLPVLRRANVHGALDMGLSPGMLPGRVTLGDASAWFEQAWGSVPAELGRDTGEILAACTRGEIDALVLLGADPLSDFPDRALAERALTAVPFVVAIGTHRDPSNAIANVVLPVAGEGERSGSTTNIEGRVSKLAEKVVPPGVAWPAWILASELGRVLGADLGFTNLDDIVEEIGELAPSHRGLRPELLASPSRRDGLLMPIAEQPVTIGMRTSRLVDPIATPGISSVEEQGAPIRVGAAAPLGGVGSVTPLETRSLPPLVVHSLANTPVEAPSRLDAYSYRLVVRRRLYDRGTIVRESPSLLQLVEAPTLRVHTSELSRLGLQTGDRVRVRSQRGGVVVRVESDDSLTKSVVVLDANIGDDGGSAFDLIEHGVVTTDVRLETI